MVEIDHKKYDGAWQLTDFSFVAHATAGVFQGRPTSKQHKPETLIL